MKNINDLTEQEIAKILYETLYIDKWEDSVFPDDDYHKTDCIEQAKNIIKYLKEK